MSDIKLEDINDMIAAAYPPKLQARILYEDSVYRSAFWIMICSGQEAAEAYVNEEMEKYDKDHNL